MTHISFRKAYHPDKEIIFAWLAEPHVQEFWDNTQAHKDDILNFMNGKKTPSSYCGGKYHYWMALYEDKPYAMLMTIQDTPQDNIGELKLSHLSQAGHTYGIDFMIGNTAYLGKGYGAKTLSDFVDYFQAHIDDTADTFFIDPTTDNPRAKHVYTKAGFEPMGDFMMKGCVSGAGKIHHLLVKTISPITSNLVKQLITEQFPQYSTLNITPVSHSGNDNRTYHLGDDMLIRLPSAEGYAPQVPKEQQWLPHLAKHVSLQIPTPLHMGNPNKNYHWNWSIYQWLPGNTLNRLTLSACESEQLALDLAKFIKALHQTPSAGAPEGGAHNYYRGCHPSVYDKNARSDIHQLSDLIDAPKALSIWEKAIESSWNRDAVWVHGDLAPGNILLQDNTLSAVIDFGCMCIGDPACDLVMAWSFFDGNAREVFKKALNLDSNIWSRARGWALWKASFELANSDDRSSSNALKHIKIIQAVLSDE